MHNGPADAIADVLADTLANTVTDNTLADAGPDTIAYDITYTQTNNPESYSFTNALPDKNKRSVRVRLRTRQHMQLWRSKFVALAIRWPVLENESYAL